MAKSRKRLGRGLSSLMATPVSVQTAADAAETTKPKAAGPPADDSVASPEPPQADDAPAGQGLTWLSLDVITPNPHQPRQAFDEAALAQLADSIKQDGLMQPIVVRQDPDHPEQYQIVAGERRWRAGRIAEVDRIPAIVRDLSDRQIAEWALVENLQREDLDPIERAEAFRHLIDQFGLTHDDVADRVGASRASVSNTIRLLDLEPELQDAIRQQRLTTGHAKVLLPLGDPEKQLALGRRAIAGAWPIRKLEQAVRRAMAGDQEAGDRKPSRRAAHFADLEDQIGEQLQTKVKVKPGRKKGSGAVTIEFYSLEQFDTLLHKLGIKLDS